jgi:hypothetical protein
MSKPEVYRKPRKPFKRSAETKWLIERLLKAECGEVVTYDELSQIAEEDVQKQNRHILSSALRILRNEYKIAFGCEQGIGVKRLDSVGVIGELHNHTRQIRNKAKRGIKFSGCIQDLQELPQEKRCECLAKQSYLSMVAKTAKDNNQKKLEDNMRGKEIKLNTKQLLVALAE